VKKKKVRPIPAGVLAGKYEIVDSDGHGGSLPPLEGRAGRFIAPLYDGDVERYVRYHEYGHLKLCDACSLRTPLDVVNKVLSLLPQPYDAAVVEHWVHGVTDAVVNYVVHESGASKYFDTINVVDYYVSGIVKQLRKAKNEDLRKRVALTAYAALLPFSYSSVAYKKLQKVLSAASLEDTATRALTDVLLTLFGQFNAGRLTEDSLASAVAALLLLYEKPIEEEKKGEDEGEGGDEGEDEGEGEGGRHGEDGLDKLVQHLACRAYEAPEAPRNTWGEMTIVTPPLTKTKYSMPLSRRWARGYCGALRYPWRIITDGKLFGLKKDREGAAILIDCSGSMCPRPELIAQIVALAPASIVALYASERDTLKRGKLVIVADKGRMADVEKLVEMEFGNGNVVDGPALRWLSKQRQRVKIWISDGNVTGVGDAGSYHLTLDAFSICKRARIRRINSLEEALEYFQRLYGRRR